MNSYISDQKNRYRALAAHALLFAVVIMFFQTASFGQPATGTPGNISYVVSMPEPQDHVYHVKIGSRSSGNGKTALKMSAWTPGYYELVDFASAVSNLSVKTVKGKPVTWRKTDRNTWLLNTSPGELLEITYSVKAVIPFIGNIYLDENYGYIIPGGLLLYTNDALHKPATIEIQPYNKWPSYVATGLNPVGGKINVFYAANFDELFDSPLLIGKLEALPEFKVQGKIHQFIGHGLEEFDRKGFMSDLQKIVQAGSEIIGDIPYNHYSFLAIPTRRGFGGIEHLNSASLMLATRNVLSDTAARNVFYTFLAHEYFHTYNVKRIRPIELGPFDYSKENYTNLLWISEGFTDYYQYLIVKAAGLTNNGNILEAYRQHIANYENKPGHLLESAAQASHNLWAEGEDASTRSAEQQAKTISVYDKGCAIGLMLDLKIRHETQNRRTLDDVMRILYTRYYKQLHRGFTEQEFWNTCESTAGTALTELKSYANTTVAPDYPKYFRYAGLNIDTVIRQRPGVYLGADAVYTDSSFVVRAVEWPYGAWKAGITAGDRITSVNGNAAVNVPLEELLKDKHAGETVTLKVRRKDEVLELPVILSTKTEKDFTITPLKDQTDLQQKIYHSWLRDR